MERVDAPSVFGWLGDVGGCGYFRIGLPFCTAVERHGADWLNMLELDDRCASLADLVVGQRVHNQEKSSRWRELHEAGKPLIYELDDDIWHMHPSNLVGYEYFSRPEVQRSIEENIALADVVTVTNEHLAAVVGEFNPEVVILPNYIKEALLDLPMPSDLEGDCVTLGWAGSASHGVDFEVVRKPLRRFLTRNPDVRMKFYGTDYSELLGKGVNSSCEMKWNNNTNQYQQSLKFDIGVIPLADFYFNRSKSYIKALELAALGIPVVASNTGPYPEFVQHGVTGFLCNEPWEWEKYLTMLVNDHDLRAEMGTAARELASEHTIEKNCHRWIDLYTEVASRRLVNA